MSEFSSFSGPKGVPDYVPPDSARFVAVRTALLDAARRAGYSDIELPIFEDTALFARGVGESTDVVFTGDTLFERSVGRTDLFGGSGRDLLRSIVDKLLVLDDKTVVLPGHGNSTTIGAERQFNPYIEGLGP